MNIHSHSSLYKVLSLPMDWLYFCLCRFHIIPELTKWLFSWSRVILGRLIYSSTKVILYTYYSNWPLVHVLTQMNPVHNLKISLSMRVSNHHCVYILSSATGVKQICSFSLCMFTLLFVYPCVTTQNCWIGFCAVWYCGFLLLQFQLKLDTINEHFVWRPKYASMCFSGTLLLYGNYFTTDKYFKWSCIENNKFYAQSTSLCFSK